MKSATASIKWKTGLFLSWFWILVSRDKQVYAGCTDERNDCLKYIDYCDPGYPAIYGKCWLTCKRCTPSLINSPVSTSAFLIFATAGTSTRNAMSSTQVIMGPINVTSSHTTIRGTTEVISTLCVVMLNTTTFPGNRALDPSVLVTTLPGNGTLDLSVCWPATTSSPNWGISLNTSGRKHFFWVITCSILVGLLNT